MARVCVVLGLLTSLLGCAQAHDLDHGVGGPDDDDAPAAAGASGGSALGSCDEQIKKALDGLPEDLACVGLYLDVADKKVAKDARPFTPAHLLWSDGAEKSRWIQLPEGEKIDATQPKDWVFPIGTTFYKEFSADGQRVETRVFRKTRSDRWVRGTYKWNLKETAARRTQGEDLGTVALGGAAYHIPTGRECDLCHDGRKDRVLGFEAVSLGMEGAKGITLQDLVDEDLIEPKPKSTRLEIGDDGATSAAKVLGWLHINCGVSCHNDNTDSEAYSSGLRLELNPDDLDGRSAAELDVVKTTVGVNAKTLRWAAEKRIVPGSPEMSLLFKLIAFRGGGKNDQMPPVASKVTDPEYLDLIEQWIRGMPSNQPLRMGTQ
jgi:hypothetical protein